MAPIRHPFRGEHNHPHDDMQGKMHTHAHRHDDDDIHEHVHLGGKDARLLSPQEREDARRLARLSAADPMKAALAELRKAAASLEQTLAKTAVPDLAKAHVGQHAEGLRMYQEATRPTTVKHDGAEFRQALRKQVLGDGYQFYHPAYDLAAPLQAPPWLADALASAAIEKAANAGLLTEEEARRIATAEAGAVSNEARAAAASLAARHVAKRQSHG